MPITGSSEVAIPAQTRSMLDHLQAEAEARGELLQPVTGTPGGGEDGVRGSFDGAQVAGELLAPLTIEEKKQQQRDGESAEVAD